MRVVRLIQVYEFDDGTFDVVDGRPGDALSMLSRSLAAGTAEEAARTVGDMLAPEPGR